MKLARIGLVVGLFENKWIQALSEVDDGVAEQAVARDAATASDVLIITGDTKIAVVRLAAIGAFFDSGIAVEFADVILVDAGLEMEAIDILRDDSGKFISILELDDCHVAEGWASEMKREGLEFAFAALGFHRPQPVRGAVVFDTG